MRTMKLFDNFEKQDLTIFEAMDSPFHILNTDASRACDRNTFESWFKDFPSSGQVDLRPRFRSHDMGNHEGAFFELFLHALFKKLECSMEVHPEIPSTTKRPDFRVRHGKEHFYLEATAVGQDRGPFTRNRNEEDVVRKLETLTSPQFDIVVDYEGELKQTLGRRDVRVPFEKLLNDHQPEDVQRQIEHGGWSAAPSEPICHDGWRLRGWLMPVDQQGDISDKNRQVRVHPAVGKFTNVVSPLRKALKDKAKKYASLDAPLVMAVQARDPFYNGKSNDMDLLLGDEQILYIENDSDWSSKFTRKPNGLWSCNKVREIDAVAIFQKADAFNVHYSSACLYVNPWKTDTVLPDVLFILPHAKVCDRAWKWSDGENIARILSLQ